MEQPPREDRRGGDQQPKDLVAPIDAPLLVSPLPLGLLLLIRFDLGLHHASV